jgi:YVTN family beta-propeller protein
VLASNEVDFRLLGLLEVAGERPIAVRRGKESALLALLLLHANEPVSSDRIVEALWGVDAPETAAKTVQVYVSRLRKALDADRLATTAGGYLIRVGEDELDAARFERLVEQARRADPREAERLLTEALALWRGPALADFRFDSFAQDDIRRLDDLRNTAVADRVDARLALGRHDEVIGELDQLLVASPLWERPRAQLMLALYRAGRQSDALDLYRRTRKLLADELGLEPSAELQTLERQILNRDPALGSVASPRRASDRSRRGPILVAVGGVTIALAAAAAIVVARGGHGGAALEAGTPDSLVQIDPTTNRIAANIPVGPGPAAVAASRGSVWVVRAGDPALVEVDPRSARIASRTHLPGIPADLAVTGRGAWIASPFVEPGELVRVAPGARVTQEAVTANTGDDLFAPRAPSAVVAAGDTVWTNAYGGRLAAIEGGRTRYVALGRGRSADDLAAGANSIWVASSVDDSVLRVDPATELVVRIPLASVAGRRVVSPLGIAYGDGSVWVTGARDDTVARIDPRVNGVVARIPVGRRPTRVAVGAGAVWVMNAGAGTVSRVDPATNTVVSTIAVAPAVTGVAAGDGAVWVTVAGGVPARAASAPPPVHALPRSLCGPLVKGDGPADVLVVSDLPTYVGGEPKPDPGIQDLRTAILQVLRDRHFRAGSYRVAYQACDASRGHELDPARCAELARAYARNGSVVAVVGPYQSDCARIELPILAAAPHGPIGVVSPTNTYVGLTHEGPATAGDEPDRYYPVGVRNYVRVAAPDDGQGAAIATLVRKLGRSRVYILDDAGATGVAMTEYVQRALRRLGVAVVGRAGWGQPSAAGFRSVVERVRASRADAVVLTGCICEGGTPLVVELRRVLGRRVPLIGSDNFVFTDDMSRGGFLEGLYLTGAASPAQAAPPAARRFLARAFPGRGPWDFDDWILPSADATLAALGAVEASDGTAAGVTDALVRGRVDGLARRYAFDVNGDPITESVAVYRVSRRARPQPHRGLRGVVFDRVIDARPELVAP